MKPKKQKQGVSLMVLVITIIVMVVLAGTVIVSLNNSGIIGRSQGAVNEYNLKQVQELANVAWGEAFVKGNRTAEDLKAYILNDLEQNGVALRYYNIEVTTKGVVVTQSDGRIITTLGALVTSALDYGKTVNYEANGVTGWKVFLKQTVAGEEYVYLIASENIPNSAIPKNIPETTVSDGKIWFPDEFVQNQATIENKELWFAEYRDYGEVEGTRSASYFIAEQYWTAFKNAKYGENVVGAIGTPTGEMFIKSYNERSVALGDTGENSTLTFTTADWGQYFINEKEWGVALSRQDELYLANDEENTWIAAPCSGSSFSLMYVYYSSYDKKVWFGDHENFNTDCGVRPVVCLKASTPASAGLSTDNTDIILK